MATPIHINPRDLDKYPELKAAIDQAVAQEPGETTGPDSAEPAPTTQSPENHVENSGSIPPRREIRRSEGSGGGGSGPGLLRRHPIATAIIAGLLVVGGLMEYHSYRVAQAEKTLISWGFSPAQILASENSSLWNPEELVKVGQKNAREDIEFALGTGTSTSNGSTGQGDSGRASKIVPRSGSQSRVHTGRSPAVVVSPPIETHRVAPPPAQILTPPPQQQSETPPSQPVAAPAVPAPTCADYGLTSGTHITTEIIHDAKFLDRDRWLVISTDSMLSINPTFWGWLKGTESGHVNITDPGVLGYEYVQGQDQAQAIFGLLKATHSFLDAAHPETIIRGQVSGPDIDVLVGVEGSDGQIHTIPGRIDSGSEVTNFPLSFLQQLGYSPEGTGTVNGVTGSGPETEYSIPYPSLQYGGWQPLGTGNLTVWGLQNDAIGTALIGEDVLQRDALSQSGDSWALAIPGGLSRVPSDGAGYWITDGGGTD